VKGRVFLHPCSLVAAWGGRGREEELFCWFGVCGGWGAAGHPMCPLRHTPAELREGGHERMRVLCQCVGKCLFLGFFIICFLFVFFVFFTLSDLCGDWVWVWDLLSSGLLVQFPRGGECCLSPLLAASPTCGHILTPKALDHGYWGMRWPTMLGCLGRLASQVLDRASTGGFRGARALGARVWRTAHVWVVRAWQGRWAVALGSQGASALCLWGLCPGPSSVVFWVDAWLSLRWASRVLCSMGAAGGLGLVALSN